MVFAVYLACLFTVPKMNAQFGLFALFGLAIWLSSFGVEWFYQALEQYEYITVRSVCFKLLALCSCSLLYGSAATTRYTA